MTDTSTYRPQRPRTSSVLSWGSHKSKDSQPKVDLTETERDKAQRRITGKADPSVAINELQPSMRALEKNTMAPLRSMQFKDHKGEPITDPDRSNPTRPRMERPLDTIRSFEAAIDSGYNSRRYSAHPDMQSRRSSFYQTASYASPQPRHPNGGNLNGSYFDRQPDSRPESMYDQPQQNSGHGANGNYQSRRMPHGRMNSEPLHNKYSQGRQQAYQQGYDTATASSSGTYQTDQGTVSTGPSSYNGSNGEVNRLAQHAKPQPPIPQETYGVDFNGHQEDEYAQPSNGHSQQHQQYNGHGPNGMPARGRSYGGPIEMSGPPPPPPPHANGNRNQLRKPMANVNGNGGDRSRYANGYNAQSPPERPKNEKRKSWLARRFSRNG